MTTAIPESLEAKVAARLESLEADLAAMPGEEVFQRPLDAHRQWREVLENRIVTLRAAITALANLDPRIVAATEWRDFLTAWRKVLCDELLALPPAHTANERDLRLGKAQNLTFSIQCLDRGIGVLADTGWALNTLRLGELMREAGYREGPRIENQVHGEMAWFGSLSETERRLRDLEQQRSVAQAQLDAAMREPAMHQLVAEPGTFAVAAGLAVGEPS